MRSFLLFFFALHASLLTLHAQDASFYKENITMKIEKDYFYVTGDYFLKTSGDSSIVLVYPFPDDSLYGEVDTIFVFNVNENKPVEILDRRDYGVVFKINFEENNEVHLLISYRQKLLGNKAEYILETTASWRKPLEQADYQLIIPAEMQIVSFSYQPDHFMNAGDERIFYWSRQHFMPVVNMVFEFR
jgi:hypothetical protein